MSSQYEEINLDIGFFYFDNFDIHIKGGLLKKYKMIDLLKLEGTSNPKAQLMSHMIMNNTIKLNKYKIPWFFPFHHGVEAAIKRDWKS